MGKVGYLSDEARDIHVSFHIGRGGSYNNAGHLSFHGEEFFQDLIRRCTDVCMIVCEDEKGEPLADEDWRLVDTGGNVILQGREEIESDTGRLEWDTIYETDYVTTVGSLSDAEVELIWNAYLSKEYMSDELKDAICTLKGMKRVSEIRRYPSNLTAYDQNASTHIDIDGKVGEFSREEWREILADKGFDPLSVERIIDKMEHSCYTNDKEFFSEDNV